MGVNLSLTRYPADALSHARSAKSFYPPNGNGKGDCFLDRSWDELHPALRAFGFPLNLALSGDYGYEGGLDAFGWDGSNANGHYLAFVSPNLVLEISISLGHLTFKQVSARVSEPSRGADYLAARFQMLVGFYRAAAANGECIFIQVA